MGAGFLDLIHMAANRTFFQIAHSAVALALLAAAAGCVSRSKAAAQARAAFAAGQRDALLRHNATPDPSTTAVSILGPVKNPVIPWIEGLNLSQAILTAEYLEHTEPKIIRVKRPGHLIEIDVSRLLRGEDIPLQPGDTIELQ
jgi:hypothetical protein